MRNNELLAEIKYRLGLMDEHEYNNTTNDPVVSSLYTQFKRYYKITNLYQRGYSDAEVEILGFVLDDIESVEGYCPEPLTRLRYQLGLLEELEDLDKLARQRRMTREEDYRARYGEEFQELADMICQSERHTLIPIDIKDVRTGSARYRTGRITMPIAWCKDGDEVAWAIIIHEVCHFLEYRDWKKRPYGRHRTNCHGEIFKRYETKWLHRFGMRPAYKRSYWKALFTLHGNMIWQCS